MEDNGGRSPERARGCLEPHKTVSKMLRDARPLSTPSVAGVWTSVWGLVYVPWSVAEPSRDV